MSNPEVFRSRSGIIATIVVLCGALLLLAQTIFYPQGEDLLATILWALTFSLVSYWLFVHPKVIVFDEGITIRNPINEVTVSWADIDEIDVQYTMSIEVAGKKIHAWAAPAPGRYHARNVHASELRGMRFGNKELIKPGESPRSYSGAAAQLARIRYENFRKGDFARIENQLHTPTTLLTGIFLVSISALVVTIL